MASSSSPAEAAARPVAERRAGRYIGWVALALLLAGLSWQLGSLQRGALLDDLEQQARQELDLYVSHLTGQLDRYAFLAPLLADDFRLQSLLIAPDNADQRDRVNRFLAHVNEIAGSLDVYLMDTRGETLAASNWRDPLTFVGRNFAFRPYFADAMAGHQGRYFALGTTSGQRGYYFSSPVGERDQPSGVVVVKIDIATFENEWRARDSELVVTDPDGVVFISTRPAWRYRSTRPLDEASLTRIRASRRYPHDALAPLYLREYGRRPSGARLLQIDEPHAGRYLALHTAMPAAGWQVQLLLARGVIEPQVWQTRLFALSLMTLAVTVAWLYRARRRRRHERDAEKQAALHDALAELEQRVTQRTGDLTEANRRLRREIEEHERTRDELIQAAKLAALGQMSAGINHELNQPLAAMRTYADNARAYLVRGDLDKVGWNLQQISELTGRMAQISGQLKVFSRKASGQRIRVSVRACLDGALRILRARIEHAGAELSVDFPAHELFVAADMVQLEQVLVNLVGNACDALAGAAERRITVAARQQGQQGQQVLIEVSDTGPGIAESHMARIFDPFFTTTESGLGLGLSISHTIAQRLGGTLSAANTADGGARFTLTLAAWQEAAVAQT